jgi:hypothetical protein
MGMGCRACMGYGLQFPAYQLGGLVMLCVKGGYGLSQLWDKTSSTVHYY